MSQRLRMIVVSSLMVGATACGGSTTSDGDPSTTADATDAPDQTTAAPTTTEPSLVATAFTDAQPAVIQIIAQGTFRDPEVGFSDGSGAGSGFIISSDGLAVTNNHVVAGAATIEVFIGGDDSTGYNATILGVSECNDLALIDISEPEPLIHLDWYTDDISAGLDVYAAGFPLGDPEYTLTRGIVSKAEAGGDLTGTSSIDHTIEHDANIQPGNSGGPLLAEDGRVVAVNYAGGASATTTAQFFGIASDLAIPVIERLRDGDFESLGINGWAVLDETNDLAGIWVAGVAAGSPASAAGIAPGDIVTSMNGLPVGTDGTFKDYCDVIRTAGDNAIAVEVLRYDTSEVLRGEINGGIPLTLAFSFADAIEQGTTIDDAGTPATVYSGYQQITDDLDRLIIEVPNEWTDIDTTPLVLDDGVERPYVSASPDLSGFYGDYDTPGVVFYLDDPKDDLAGFLDQFAPPAEACVDSGISDYTDGVFTGVYQLWGSCGGTETVIVALAAVPADGSYTAVVVAQLVNDADVDVLDQIFATFNVLD